jgi:hypothetical protein
MATNASSSPRSPFISRLRIVAATILLFAGLGGCLALIYGTYDTLQVPAVLLGLAPQVLPAGAVPYLGLLRVLGWIWFGVPVAIFLYIQIAIWNGAAVL